MQDMASIGPMVRAAQAPLCARQCSSVGRSFRINTLVIAVYDPETFTIVRIMLYGA
jgi:hypothetical protein